ncbi:MAG: PLP-dependent aminotransferase family protein [Chloroflexi bacterium]|jgi:2-aminoadipate transaminase|nr:PLP-dependent aminotransferase family protein [Chloroflexota bacterium]
MTMNWEALYSERLGSMTTSVIREILKVAQSPEVISLSGGWPEADLFPTEQLQEVAAHVMRETPREALQYGLTDGSIGLRQLLAEQMQAQGVPAGPENILITSGSQQALDLLGRILLDEGDCVIVEAPTFLGAVQSFKAYGPRFVPLPLDGDGACVELLPELISRHKPKLMYLLPTFHNPAGVCLSLERRRRAVEIASEMGVPIVEDDPYGQLRYSGEPLPTLAALDSARCSAHGPRLGNTVIYLSTFSKTLTPGLRVAWAVAPVDVVQQLVMAKQGADLMTSSLSQEIAAEFIRRGWLPGQVARIRDTYRLRRDAMCAAIDDFFPSEASYYRPEGGLFLWVTLPEGLDATALLAEAAVHQVAYVPGQPFFVDGRGTNTLRMSFASVPPETIREGVRRVGEVFKAHL